MSARAGVGVYKRRWMKTDALRRDGFTCVDGAMFQGRPEVVEWLLTERPEGVSFNHEHETDGFRPIHRAIWGKGANHAIALRTLLRLGKIDPNEETSNGDVALQIAIDSRNARAVRILLEEGADPESLSDPNYKQFAHDILTKLDRDENGDLLPYDFEAEERAVRERREQKNVPNSGPNIKITQIDEL